MVCDYYHGLLGKDDRLFFGEENVEILIRQSMGMLAGRLQLHEVHHIHHADLQLRDAPAQDRHGCEHLLQCQKFTKRDQQIRDWTRLV